MSDLIAVQKIAGWEKSKGMVLDSVSSPITKRVYKMALDEFMAWFQQEPRPRFHQGHRERLAGIPGGPRARLVIDHHTDVGDSQTGGGGCR
jgi:hypothetical protein